MSRLGSKQTAIAARRVDPVACAPRSSLLWRQGATAPTSLDVLGLSMANVTLHTAAADLVASTQRDHQTRVVFVNAHVVNEARRDRAYCATIASADVRYADGSGLAIAARLAGHPFVDNVNGTDLLPLLAAEAVRCGASLFLLGGAPGAAAGSASTLAAQGFPHAIAGTHHGFFAQGSAEEDRVIERINASGARILLVGMGVPLQDQWIERNAHRLAVPVLVGVGGLFDFFSGRVSRAPAPLRRLGLEWTWRLAQEPRRMWRRYVIGNATFLAYAARRGLKARMT